VLSVEQMVKTAIDIWGNGEYTVPVTETKLHEAKILKLDISKAANELNWKPKLTAQQAVQQTIAWYKVYFNNIDNISGYTEQQILDFIAL
jgi:CDP-glucose 4,6-dehydratase